MRKTAGLPPPERRIGLSAHDFAQAACAPQVVLLHSERRGGAPAVRSRWLWRLHTLARGAGVELPSRPEVLAWARALDAPATFKPATRPKPTPPLAARPREMAVTAIERWIRDPYGLYARSILRLRPLERPDEPIEARARGTAIHKAFEKFAHDHPEALPDNPHLAFADLLIAELEAAGMPRARLTRERALAGNVAPWVIAFEQRRRVGAPLVEQSGRHSFVRPRRRLHRHRQGRPHRISHRNGRHPRLQDRRAAVEEAGGKRPVASVDPDRRHPAPRRLHRDRPHRGQ